MHQKAVRYVIQDQLDHREDQKDQNETRTAEAAVEGLQSTG